jgi:hypothetical protein
MVYCYSETLNADCVLMVECVLITEYILKVELVLIVEWNRPIQRLLSLTQTLGVSWAFACYNERCFTGRHQRRAHLDSPKFPSKSPRNYLLPGRVLVLGNGERGFERRDTLV